MYVYKKTEVELWTVGFYDPSNRFITDTDHDNAESAAIRVHYLNGGDPPITLEKSALMIAGHIAQSWGGCNGHEVEIARLSRALAEAVIEECNK